MARPLLRRRLLLSAIPAIGAALSGGTAHAAETTVSLAGLDVTIWRPAGTAPAALPIVIFSHGFHGCATQSRFLTTAFAAAGHLVFSPNHGDATCHGGSARWIDPPEQRFGKPTTWTEASFRDRADDIHRLIAALKADAAWQNVIDWRRLGVVGHSLGGYTALGLAGAWPSWQLKEAKAVLALSPYVQPFLARHTLPGLAAPVMYQGGTLDFGITPWVGKAMGAYDVSPAPKYYVEMRRAGHLAWTDIGGNAHEAIVAYSLAFLNRYLLGDAAAAPLTRATAGVATLRYAL